MFLCSESMVMFSPNFQAQLFRNNRFGKLLSIGERMKKIESAKCLERIQGLQLLVLLLILK